MYGATKAKHDGNRKECKPKNSFVISVPSAGRSEMIDRACTVCCISVGANERTCPDWLDSSFYVYSEKGIVMGILFSTAGGKQGKTFGKLHEENLGKVKKNGIKI